MSLLLFHPRTSTFVAPPTWVIVEGPDTDWERIEDAISVWEESLVVRPIEPTVLLDGFRQGVLPDDTSITIELGDITPTRDRPVIAWILAFLAVNGQPTPEMTVSGGGIDSWVESMNWEYSNDGETAIVLSAWTGVDDSPSSGTLSLNFPAVDATQFLEQLDFSVIGLKNADPHGTVVQSSHSITEVDLDDFASENNIPLAAGFFFLLGSGDISDPQIPDGFTELSDTTTSITPSLVLQTSYGPAGTADFTDTYFSLTFQTRFPLPTAGLEIAQLNEAVLWDEDEEPTTSWERQEGATTTWV